MQKPAGPENHQVRLGVVTRARRPTSPGTALGLWVGLIVLFIPLVVYIYTLCPTVFVGDAGDFVTAAYTLGVPHPPGYPVYTMLGHLFTHLPIPGGISAPAYRMNFMSALAAWGACVFMFLFLRRVLKTEWAALAGALVLAFSREFWTHAEIAEVYTLQILFLTLMLYLAVLYVQEKKVGWALLLAFIMGLAIAHQYAVLLFYPGILIFIGLNGGLRLRWYTWVLAILIALIGLTPYAYLPIVKYKTPLGEVVFVKDKEEASLVPMDKVAIEDPPLAYFLDYFTRRLYTKARQYTNAPDVLTKRTTTPMVLKKTLEVTRDDFEIPLMIFALLGWISLILSLRWRRRKPGEEESLIPVAAFLPPALGYILYFLVVHFYPSGDILAAPLENIAVVIPPLLLPLEAALAAIIALGFDFAQRGIGSYICSQGVDDLSSSEKYRVFTILLAIAAFTLVGVNTYRNAESCDKSQSVISYYYALNVLDSCDKDAILLTTGDETFLFWYVQSCEPPRDPYDRLPGYRKDVWATNWIHNLPGLDLLEKGEPYAMAVVTERFIASSTYYKDYLAAHDVPLIEPDYGARPINSTFVSSSFVESGVIMYLDVVLQGITFSFRRPGDVPDVSLPEVRPRADMGQVESGAAPMMVVDYFDARPFKEYKYAGLPRFEGTESDVSELAKSDYIPVNLDAQELEVLGRYQDSFYRFGVQALLEDTPESDQEAVSYLFRCVSLHPDNWFGWKELGDAFFSTGRIDSAEQAYRTLLDLGTIESDIDPDMLAAAHAQLGHVALIHGGNLTGEDKERALAAAENEARIALALNPDDKVAAAVLTEIQRQRSESQTESGEQPATGNEQPSEDDGGESGDEGGLHSFEPPPTSGN